MTYLQKIIKPTTLLIVLASAISVSAQQSIFTGTSFFSDFSLKNIVDILINVVGGALIPLFIAALMFFFVINIIIYIRSLESGQTDVIENAKKRLLYPLFAVSILFTLWGIIYIIRLFFGT